MWRKAWCFLVVSAWGVGGLDAMAGPGNGAKVAEQCVSCHGARGISSGPLWPNLKGQRAEYMIKQLKDFKRGVRRDPMMTLLVQSLTEEDMRDVSLYFSGLE
ncbi:MAG: cytochrome c [Gammaproteobacteria bacterium]|nr:cytochrome c [Gammaproteobacteria bacterium]